MLIVISREAKKVFQTVFKRYESKYFINSKQYAGGVSGGETEFAVELTSAATVYGQSGGMGGGMNGGTGGIPGGGRPSGGRQSVGR